MSFAPRFPLRFVSSLSLAALVAGCSAGATDTSEGDTSGDGGDETSGPSSSPSTGTGFGSGGSSSTGTFDDCAASAKLIYVLSTDYQLYSFDPTIPGTAAYKLVGNLNCPSNLGGSPQSMAVDRSGTAYVFFDSGELFAVSTLDASCQATSYVHPNQDFFNQLGMGFTAATPGSSDEVLYIVSPIFGLATVDTSTFAVSQLGVLTEPAELTGGADARLFRFAADSAQLGEIAVGSWSVAPIHTFSNLAGTTAWAFSRYAGKFYTFTSPGGPSTTTEFDPSTNASSTRDASVGFTIIGAGQSTCVPAPAPQ
jgi:hypothetical protein